MTAMLLVVGSCLIAAGLLRHATYKQDVGPAARAAGMLRGHGGTYKKFVGGFEARINAAAGTFEYNLIPLIGSDVDCRRVGTGERRESPSGVPEFDNYFIFSGSSGVLAAIFVPKAELLAEWMRRHSAYIERGVMRVPINLGINQNEIVRMLFEFESLGLMMRTGGGSLAERMLTVVKDGTLSIEARTRCLEHLVRFYNPSASLEQALTFAHDAMHPELQIRAAVLTRDWKRMAELLRDDTVPSVLRIELVPLFQQRASKNEGMKVLQELARSHDEELAVAAIVRLRGKHAKPLASKMLALALAAPEGNRRLALLRTVASLADESLSHVICEALTELRDAETLIMAPALGRIGKIESVAPLLALRKRLGFGNVPEKRAIDAAVAQIQSRAVGADAGQISVALEEAGALSVHDIDSKKER